MLSISEDWNVFPVDCALKKLWQLYQSDYWYELRLPVLIAIHIIMMYVLMCLVVKRCYKTMTSLLCTWQHKWHHTIITVLVISQVCLCSLKQWNLFNMQNSTDYLVLESLEIAWVHHTEYIALPTCLLSCLWVWNISINDNRQIWLFVWIIIIIENLIIIGIVWRCGLAYTENHMS